MNQENELVKDTVFETTTADEKISMLESIHVEQQKIFALSQDLHFTEIRTNWSVIILK